MEKNTEDNYHSLKVSRLSLCWMTWSRVLEKHIFDLVGKLLSECPEVNFYTVSLDMLKSWIAAVTCYCDKKQSLMS